MNPAPDRASRRGSPGATDPDAREPGARVQGRELRARGKRTLARLLDAGGTVFSDRGYHAARVDDIVKAAKTSHGTFYLYFSSKQDLFRAVAVGVASEMIDLARDLPALDPDGAVADDALRDWLDRFASLYQRHGAFIRTWTEAEIADSEIGNIANDLVTQFSRELARRVRAAAPDLDPAVTAFALVSMIERFTYLVEAEQLAVGRADALPTLAHATMAALHGRRART
jgi:AcrR family transcriptional regulator